MTKWSPFVPNLATTLLQSVHDRQAVKIYQEVLATTLKKTASDESLFQFSSQPRYNVRVMKAEIIAVGSELLTPDRIDTNSLFLTEELNKLGIEVLRKTIVGDNRELLAAAFKDALNRVSLVIASGGLGPTEDDLTRETLADLLGRKLHRSDEVVRAIEARFRSFKRDMPSVNLRQAMVPEGAEVLNNPRGTAPGLWLEDAGRMIALLPGRPEN